MTLIALLQAKNEAEHIGDWLENVGPAVDGIIALDDGSTDGTREILAAHPRVLELMSNPPGQSWNEYANQVALIKAARRHGASWLLCLDADERLETALAGQLPALIAEADSRGVTAFALQLRDLWNDEEHYRADGDWAKRARYRLFRNIPTQNRFDPKPLHRSWMPLEMLAGLKTTGVHLPFAIYHFGMLTPAIRQARYERYRALDPDNRLQPQGYEHLIDEAGLVLAEVTPDRGFHPKRGLRPCDRPVA